MSTDNQDIVFVTPVFRDSGRLSTFGPCLARTFAGSVRSIRWIIADDGSGPDETTRLKEMVADYRQIHPNTEFYEKGEHLGKGGTVRAAWAAHSNATWLAFADADGSVTGATILALMETAMQVGPGQAVLGSRMYSPQTTVVQTPLRRITHKAFAAMARMVLKLPLHDFQCGAKMVDSKSFQAVADQLVEDGFAFDSELLVALHQHGVGLIEVPVDWAEKSGGTVRPLAEAKPMLTALLRIRRRKYAGHYDPN